MIFVKGSKYYRFIKNWLRPVTFLYSLALAAILPLVFFTNLPVWMDTMYGVTNAPLLYLMILLSIGPFVLAEGFGIRRFVEHPYVLWCLFTFFVLGATVVRLQVADYTVGADLDNMIDLTQKFVLVFAFAYLAYVTPTKYYNPFLSVLCIVAPLAIIFDFLSPGVIAPETGTARAAATWFNPNVAGEAVLLSLVLAHDRIRTSLFSLAFVLAAVAVILTGSRSAMIGWALLGAFFLYRGSLPKIFILVPIFMVLFYSTILYTIEDAISTNPDYQDGAENLLSRLQFVAGQKSMEEGGGDQRLDIAQRAYLAASERWFVGYGHEYEDAVVDGGAGPHNLVISLWHFFGLAGLIVWSGIVFVLFRHTSGVGWIKPAALIFVWFSMFSHNLLEGNYWLVFFAMMVFSNYKSPILQSNPKFAMSGVSARGKRRKRRRRRHQY